MLITEDAPEAKSTPMNPTEVVLTADAGWYAAPDEPGLERYWSGSAWSEDRRPLADATSGGIIAAIGRAISRRLHHPTGPSAARV